MNGLSTYQHELDFKRLSDQLGKVRDVMLTGKRYTLRELADAANCLETSASARLRELRKYGWTIDRARRGDPKRGLFEYWGQPGGAQ